MIVTHKLNMDLEYCGETPPRIDVAQDDRYSRDLALSLLMNGKKWFPGNGTSAVVNYVKPDGTGGSYNFLPDETPAWRLEGNVMTVALAPQVCTVAGLVKLAVSLIRDAARISTFTIELNVHKNPGLSVNSEDYYKITGMISSSGWTPNMLLGTDKDGEVVAVASAVQTINGVPPDENGNISLTISTLPHPAAAQAEQYLRVKQAVNGQVTAVEAVYVDAPDIVAYMYDGRRLPPLPEWDAETYPCALVSVSKREEQACLFLLPELNVHADSGADVLVITADTALCTAVSLESGVAAEMQWSPFTAPETENIALSSVEWTNTDIAGTDGDLYLAASDPAPVYGHKDRLGFAVVDLTTSIRERYEDGETTGLTETEGASLSAAVASEMPCFLRFNVTSENDDGSTAVAKCSGFASFRRSDTGGETILIPAAGGWYQFEKTDGTWTVTTTIE